MGRALIITIVILSINTIVTAQDAYMSKCFKIIEKLGQSEDNQDIISFFDLKKFDKEELNREINILRDENKKYKDVSDWRITKINREVPYYYLGLLNKKTGETYCELFFVYENKNDYLITKFNLNTKEEIEEHNSKMKEEDYLPTSPVPK